MLAAVFCYQYNIKIMIPRNLKMSYIHKIANGRIVFFCCTCKCNKGSEIDNVIQYANIKYVELLWGHKNKFGIETLKMKKS